MFDKKDAEEERIKAEEFRKKQELLRDVFTSEKGTVVLAIILNNLHYFNPTATPEQTILVNFAKDLLAQIGTGDGYEMTRAIIQSGRA